MASLIGCGTFVFIGSAITIGEVFTDNNLKKNILIAVGLIISITSVYLLAN